MWKKLIVLLVWTLVGCAGNTAKPTAEYRQEWDGTVSSYGSLREIFHEGKIGQTVTLDSLLPNRNLYAVGALAGLSGEVTVLAGKSYLSYPDGDGARVETPSQTDAAATLLVVATVPEWISVQTDRSVSFEDLEEMISELAFSVGWSSEDRFPFLVEGTFEDLRWHVVDGARLEGGGNSQQDHLDAAVKLHSDRAAATLLGFYSDGDQGVFTHIGSRTHVHCVLEESNASGHVEHVLIPAGATVKFPMPADSPGG